MGPVFDPDHLHEVARQAVGQPFDEMVRTIVDALAAAYPGHVAREPDWMFNYAGGVSSPA